MFEYREFIYAFALVMAVFTLGLLLVCVPRPRKEKFMSVEELALEKRDNTKLKSQAKARRLANKAKKKTVKSKEKKMAAKNKSKKKKK